MDDDTTNVVFDHKNKYKDKIQNMNHWSSNIVVFNRDISFKIYICLYYDYDIDQSKLDDLEKLANGKDCTVSFTKDCNDVEEVKVENGKFNFYAYRDRKDPDYSVPTSIGMKIFREIYDDVSP
jgi:hypothetical protein